VVGGALLAYACGVERRWLSVTHHTVAVAHLPPAWDCLRVVHVSDLHLGAPGTPYGMLRRAVAVIARLRPHLIALTGDYSDDGEPRPMDVLAPLPAIAPTVAVLGNHDYFAGAGDAIAAALAARGITVLRNAALRFEHRGVCGLIAGLDDDLAGPGADVAGLVRRLAPTMPVLALIHAPDLVERFPARWAGLTLAGHTHGAQVRLSPFRQVDWIRWALDQKRSRYPRGWFEVNGNPLYVSRGLGVAGLPIRFAARPELACITLTRS
jgi:predicted MPP superfamily phosphohydrolase